jgi:adenine-specific DNA-methyltransferase
MIAHTFDEAFSLVQGLVNDFRQSEADFLSPKYSELDVRNDFINRFWMALGWDVTHEIQKNPHEREVVVEKNVDVEGRGKRADYAFSVAPNFRDVRFFVEAKKPSKKIDSPDNYFQTVRYGWNAKTPVAVLTDFEQFHVLDCRYEPDIDSVLSYASLKEFHYSDYADPEKFRWIYHLFSRSDVGGGSLDRYAEGLLKPGAKKGQRALFVTGRFKSVDEAFLQHLDTYRAQLAHTFKNSNPQLESPGLTEVTQRTLDRLVFIRFLEDKDIETSELVQKIVNSQRPWREFVNISRKLNDVYNGIIFREHTILDAADFKIDERTFRDICDSLSHARSPYLFNYIPIHILGSIYERFLGKTIIVEGAEASVQDKPEVRKAGGVYYTPEYIVRYIVENTVGQLIEGKKPEEISRMRFADISCGSGSFLLGVFDLLLRYHRNYYNANQRRRAEGRKAGCVELPDGTLQLSLKQKRAILTHNIYGVDIDAQAVEVAQLSLYLKLLEDETTASARLYQIELGDKLLPSLSKNIVSGNSLIDWDILSGKLFDKHEERKLNPMSFEDAFPQIMKDGGFDAIVGNPPYRMLQPHNTSKEVLDYNRKNYVAAEFKIELFHLFLQRGVSVLKERGCLGYIIPTTILNNVYAENLRKWLLNRISIKMISVARGRIFADADVHTTVIILCRESDAKKRAQHQIITTSQLDELPTQKAIAYSGIKQEWFTKLAGHVWNILINDDNAQLVGRLTKDYTPLNKLGAINRGLITGDRGKYFSVEKLSEAHVPIIAGSDVTRYYIKPSTEFVLFERPKTAGGCWDRDVHFAPHKIVLRQIGERPTASILLEPLAVTGNIFTVINDNLEKELYLLGLLNSKLLAYFWQIMFADFKSSFPQITIFSLSQLPVRLIDFSNSTDKARHDRMVQFVEQMLDAKKQLAEAATDRDRNLYERKCASLDRQIDELVYELYSLTPEEIDLIEAG